MNHIEIIRTLASQDAKIMGLEACLKPMLLLSIDAFIHIRVKDLELTPDEELLYKKFFVEGLGK